MFKHFPKSLKFNLATLVALIMLSVNVSQAAVEPEDPSGDYYKTIIVILLDEINEIANKAVTDYSDNINVILTNTNGGKVQVTGVAYYDEGVEGSAFKLYYTFTNYRIAFSDEYVRVNLVLNGTISENSKFISNTIYGSLNSSSLGIDGYIATPDETRKVTGTTSLNVELREGEWRTAKIYGKSLSN